jgi:chromosome segregation ATPase
MVAPYGAAKTILEEREMAENTVKSCPNCKTAKTKINVLEQKLSSSKVALDELKKAYAKLKKENKTLSNELDVCRETCELFPKGTQQ